MKELFATADFLTAVKRRMRFGELSRLPLQVQRIQVMAESAECDWLARPADPWDSSLADDQRIENETQQTLQDALKMRELLFETFPSVNCVEVRVFRECASQQLELLMNGTVLRETYVLPRVVSVAMRAKLSGFRFSLEDGVLTTMGQLQTAEQ